MGTVLWMSGEDQADVGEEARLASNDVEAAVNAVLGLSNYGDGLRKWAVLSIILGDEFPGYNEINRYRKKERLFESRLKIPHAEFKAADAIRQRRLIMGILFRSIEEMKRRAVPGIDYARLESDIRELAAAKGWI